MAVVQISRIQIRRGQKNQGSGLPQLASGELGWAIDTRELYIGNGSVSEGSPAVGNTKVLTQYDNIFSLADTYTYRTDDAFIQTGSSSVSPIQRTLQDRLDDNVSARAFGLTGVTSQNATVGLQRAIDQLFLNSATKGSEQSRVVLNLEPGIYIIDATINIPPYCILQGAGPDRTVIRQTGNFPIIKTVNDSSTPGNYANDSSSTFNNQAREIIIKDLTLQNNTTNLGMLLESCRDSVFENVNIIGPWQTADTIPADFASSTGVRMDSLSGSVESSKNKFINCKITNWAYGIMSNFDINNTVIDKCHFDYCGNAINLGVNMTLSTPATGRSTGPVNTLISNNVFSNINRYGIWVENGTYNTSKGNSFTLVGNEGGTEAQPVYSCIKFNKVGNQSVSDFFARTEALSYTQANINSSPYVPEIQGTIDYTDGFTHSLSISQTGGTKLFRLPGFANQSFIIEYQMMSETYEMQRIGTMTITTEIRSTPTVNITDDYDYSGDVTYEDNISFTAAIADVNADLTNDTIDVTVVSTMPSNDTTQFKFRVLNRKTSLV